MCLLEPPPHEGQTDTAAQKGGGFELWGGSNFPKRVLKVFESFIH